MNEQYAEIVTGFQIGESFAVPQGLLSPPSVVADAHEYLEPSPALRVVHMCD